MGHNAINTTISRFCLAVKALRGRCGLRRARCRSFWSSGSSARCSGGGGWWLLPLQPHGTAHEPAWAASDLCCSSSLTRRLSSDRPPVAVARHGVNGEPVDLKSSPEYNAGEGSELVPLVRHKLLERPAGTRAVAFQVVMPGAEPPGTPK